MYAFMSMHNINSQQHRVMSAEAFDLDKSSVSLRQSHRLSSVLMAQSWFLRLLLPSASYLLPT